MVALTTDGITVSPQPVTTPAWVHLRDPSGEGTSRVLADRIAYYLAKGFRRIGRKPEPAGKPTITASGATCHVCGFVAKDARGLAVHQSRMHADGRDA